MALQLDGTVAVKMKVADFSRQKAAASFVSVRNARSLRDIYLEVNGLASCRCRRSKIQVIRAIEDDYAIKQFECPLFEKSKAAWRCVYPVVVLCNIFQYYDVLPINQYGGNNNDSHERRSIAHGNQPREFFKVQENT
uniref:Uncharacterized protein n=1 Tax=Glossina austeni TaxID=7395 RepID=A0A1A9UVB7_GLOAU